MSERKSNGIPSRRAATDEVHGGHRGGLRRSGLAGRVAGTAGVGLVVWVAFQAASAVESARTGGQHLDFRTYHVASQVLAAGQNPYDSGLLADLANRPAVRAFLYPPSSFVFILPLRRMSYRTSADIFLLIKLAAAAGLLWIWFRRFLQVHFPSWEWLVAMLAITQAFGRPMLVDIREGNVSLLEQALIWSAFAGLCARRYLVCALLIVLASLFKLVPAIFLGVLLGQTSGWSAPEDWRRRVYAFGTGVATFAIAQVLSFAMYPSYFAASLRHAAEIDERGFHNPASLALFRDWAGVGGGERIYAGWLLLLFASAAAVLWKRSARLAPVEWLTLSTLLFALAAPRMKNYSYILLLLPLAWILTHVLRTSRGAQLAVLGAASWRWFAYQPLIAAGLLYGILVAYLVRPDADRWPDHPRRGTDWPLLRSRCAAP